MVYLIFQATLICELGLKQIVSADMMQALYNNLFVWFISVLSADGEFTWTCHPGRFHASDGCHVDIVFTVGLSLYKV